MDKHDIGDLTLKCPHCQADHFKTEASKNDKLFRRCCHKGKVFLPELQAPDEEIKELFARITATSRSFFDNVRQFNYLLAFASTSASLDPKMRTPGPYFYKICGQIHHYVSASLTANNEKPKYGQMYILDTKDATEQRMQFNSETKCSKTVIMHFANRFANEIINNLLFCFH